MADQIFVGDVVDFPLAGGFARGIVGEVYGDPPRVMVVINMTPELTGLGVDEPTTIVWPIDRVRLAKNAA
jgi:hypothetical protein